MNQATLSLHSEGHFSVAALEVLSRRLRFEQRALLDAVWTHLVNSGETLPIRVVPSVIGKQPLKQVLQGLNGGLIFETWEQGDRHLKLTVHGALLTGHGNKLANLLVRLLDLARARFEQDSLIKEIKSGEIVEQLHLEPTEARLLFLLLQLGLPSNIPVGLAGWSNDGSAWQIRVTDEIIDLFNAESTTDFLDDKLSTSYRFDEPCYLEDRQKQAMFGAHAIATVSGESHMAMEGLGERVPPYVAASRLEELKTVSGRRYDCTRLVSMCEELNRCAAQRSPHAVILLIRAVLNHVPPAFAFETFGQVAANYGGGGSSFKKAAERLENHSRRVADRLAHMPIRDKEVAPTMAEVNFSAEIETVLSEFCRVLK